MRKVIANTTPLIALANIDQLELLHKLYGTIIIPQAVMDEIVRDPARQRVRGSSWIKVEAIRDQSQKDIFRARLHAGEVEVMILAREQKADLVILDDNAAKKTAKFLGFNVTGTLGVLLKAKKEGYLEKIEPVMNELIRDGLFIIDTVKRYVLREAGEAFYSQR
jgi:predicted nucleic acid-binding protein